MLVSSWPPRRASMDGLNGLFSLRITNKALRCANLTCMIDTDSMAIGYVSSSRRISRILHDLITFTVGGHRLPHRAWWMSIFMARVETQQLCLFECFNLPAVRPQCTGDRLSNGLRRARSVGARDM